jgi:hypothetical protein
MTDAMKRWKKDVQDKLRVIRQRAKYLIENPALEL